MAETREEAAGDTSATAEDAAPAEETAAGDAPAPGQEAGEAEAAEAAAAAEPAADGPSPPGRRAVLRWVAAGGAAGYVACAVPAWHATTTEVPFFAWSSREEVAGTAGWTGIAAAVLAAATAVTALGPVWRRCPPRLLALLGPLPPLAALALGPVLFLADGPAGAVDPGTPAMVVRSGPTAAFHAAAALALVMVAATLVEAVRRLRAGRS